MHANLKSALDIENLKNELKEDLLSTPAYLKGIAVKVWLIQDFEAKPQFAQAKTKALENGTNATIVLFKIVPDLCCLDMAVRRLRRRNN